MDVLAGSQQSLRLAHAYLVPQLRDGTAGLASWFFTLPLNAQLIDAGKGSHHREGRG